MRICEDDRVRTTRLLTYPKFTVPEGAIGNVSMAYGMPGELLYLVDFPGYDLDCEVPEDAVALELSAKP